MHTTRPKKPLTKPPTCKAQPPTCTPTKPPTKPPTDLPRAHSPRCRYERAAIERWFVDHETAPLTNCVLSSKALTPHETLRAQINDFAAQHTGAAQQ